MHKLHVRIPAYRARERSLGAGEIEAYVNEQIEFIEGAVESALENSENYARCEINTQFVVKGMNSRDAQMEVYYQLAHALEQAEYKITYEFSGHAANTQRVFTVVRWTTRQDVELQNYKNNFIKSISRRID